MEEKSIEQNTNNNPHRFCYKSILEIKENLDDILVKGYIATTHFDGQDIIKKETLEAWANEINDGNPRANKVSVNHNRIPHVAGVGVKGSARVDKFSDGQYGLYVETIIDKTRQDFPEIKYRVDKGFLDSFSIEYVAPSNPKVDNGARILDENTLLCGWTLASQPMNEHAVMIKELLKPYVEVKQETVTMTEQVAVEVKEQPPAQVVVPDKKEEVIVPAQVEVKTDVHSADVVAALKELKELKEKVMQKESDDKKKVEMKEQIMAEVKEKLDEQNKQIEVKVKLNTDNKIEVKELTEFKEAFKLDSKYSMGTKVKIAGKISDMCGFTANGTISGRTQAVDSKIGKFNFEIKQDGCKHVLEYKGLGVATNRPSDTDYLLSAAELSDVFDPVIYNVLNQATVTWNILEKDDYSMKGNNQVQFTLKTAANTAYSYTGNAISTANVTRTKFMTKFKKYAVGVEVDGDMIAAARGGPIGDIFAQEVADSTVDLLAKINVDLFAEVGLETASGIIGFEFVADQAGNTTMYSLTRSQTNGLSSTTTTDNYISGASADISLANLRAAKRKAVGTEGADINRVVFITSYTQGDKFRGIYDGLQRAVPTSSRFGFEGRPSFDGIPIFEDKDCNADDWWLVDLETHRVAVWVPPTLEMLGKDADSQKGFIKTYFATYNRAPRRMVQIYSNATT